MTTFKDECHRTSFGLSSYFTLLPQSKPASQDQWIIPNHWSNRNCVGGIFFNREYSKASIGEVAEV